MNKAFNFLLFNTSGKSSCRRFVALALISLCQAGNAQIVPPPDATASCTVSPPTFDTWFATGFATLNGAVIPADSVGFPNFPNCTFYQWSEQMFLWLTSPTPSSYGGGGGRVFGSSIFYNVSPLDQNNHRTLIPNDTGLPLNFSLRSAQVGPHGLPVVISDAGKMIDVERLLLGAHGKPIMIDQLGRAVEIERTSILSPDNIQFMDRTGRLVVPRLGPHKGPLIFNNLGRPIEITKSIKTLNGRIIFLDQFGNAIEFEQGQAGGDAVLMAQNGSLVYFATFVNDVYAYFATGTKDGGITPAPTGFPTLPQDLAKIFAFAQAHGRTLTDSNALAMEVKTAWIETTGLDVSNYITINATIPKYDTSNSTNWVPNGTRQAQLALVGMHVVGSAAGHPEMIWATFEHVNNTPDATYSYRAENDQIKTVASSTAGNWLFCANNSAGPFTNTERMFFNGTGIEAVSGQTIGPSDTIRWHAWGAATDFPPNPLDATSADSNAEIISINNSVRGLLANGDVRGNYILTGATWTIGGAIPNGNSFPFPDPNPGPNDIANQVGTSQMANSTLETYQQIPFGTTYSKFANCFGCHQGNSLGTAGGQGLSHIYGPIQPLF